MDEGVPDDHPRNSQVTGELERKLLCVYLGKDRETERGKKEDGKDDEPWQGQVEGLGGSSLGGLALFDGMVDGCTCLQKYSSGQPQIFNINIESMNSLVVVGCIYEALASC